MGVYEVSVAENGLVSELLECMVEDIDHRLDSVARAGDELIGALEGSSDAAFSLYVGYVSMRSVRAVRGYGSSYASL